MDNALHPGTIVMAWVPDFMGGKVRPAIIVSPEARCIKSPRILAVPGTSKIDKRPMPTHHLVRAYSTPLKCDTLFLCEDILNVNREDIAVILGRISRTEYIKMQEPLLAALHLEATEW